MQVEFAGQYEKSQFFQAVYLALGQDQRKRIWRIVSIVIIGLLAGLLMANFLDVLFRAIFLVNALLFSTYILRPEVKAFLTASRWWQNQAIRRKISGYVSHQGLMYEASEQAWDNFLDLRATDDLVVLLKYDVRNLSTAQKRNQLPRVPDPRSKHYEPVKGASFLRETKPDHLAQKRGDPKTQPNPWAIIGPRLESVSELERYMYIFPRSFFLSDTDWKEFQHLVMQHV